MEPTIPLMQVLNTSSSRYKALRRDTYLADPQRYMFDARYEGNQEKILSILVHAY